MDHSADQPGSTLQRTSGGRGGWRLPAALVAALLIGVVVVARLGMEPPAPTGLGPTLPPVPTQPPAASPLPESSVLMATPSPTRGEPLRLGPGPSQVWADRYVDGIPLRIGDELVRRVDDVAARKPSSSVLVGGWYIGPACGRLGQAGYCPYGHIADNPASVTDWSRSVRLGGTVPVASSGPAVFRAALELECAPEGGCRKTIDVVEQVWLGDPLTDSGPIEVLPLLSSLAFAFPSLNATPVQERPDCPVRPPAQAYRVTGAGLRAILVYPTPEDRQAAEGRLRVGQRVMLVEEGGECRLAAPRRAGATWIAQDNVMLLVDNTRPLTVELARAALSDARDQSFAAHPPAAVPITAWQALGAVWRAESGLAIVPGHEQAFVAEGLPEATWMLRGANVRMIAVFPTRQARRAVDTAELPRLATTRGGPDVALRWLAVRNVLIGVSGPPDFDDRLRAELAR